MVITFVIGGCDGCIDLDNPDNGGSIRLILPLLDDLYVTESLQIFLSKADFYALAGIVAIEEGIANANEGRDPCNQLKVVCMEMCLLDVGSEVSS